LCAVAYGTITIGGPELGGVIDVVRMTCLAVSGNVAEVGGVIVQSPLDPSFVGGPFELFLRDSGQPGTASRDGFSPSFVDLPGSAKATCRDVSSNALGYGYMSLAYGDIAIQNVTNQNG
jgi:hypothetical protein